MMTRLGLVGLVGPDELLVGTDGRGRGPRRTERMETIDPGPNNPAADKPGPLRDMIRNSIRQSIFDKSFPPGMRLVERDLAARFGVSRLPVREAIRMLRQEGLVQESGARGMVVATLSVAEADDLFEVRAALEALACRLAAEKATRADLDRLAGHLRQAQIELERGQLAKAHRANSRFHDEINLIAANQALTLALEPLTGRLGWVLGQVSDLPELIREHEVLLEAISSGDPARAAAAALEHVEVNRTKLHHELLRQSPRPGRRGTD